MEESTAKLQEASNIINNWTNNQIIEIYETKSIQVNFTNNRTVDYLPMSLNGIDIAHRKTTKYLEITLDAKLRLKEHVKKKLMERKSKLSIENKLVVYNQLLKVV